MTDRKPTDRAKDHFGHAKHAADVAGRHFAILKLDKTTNKLAEATDPQRGDVALAAAVGELPGD